VSFPVILGGYTPLTLGAGAIYGVVTGTITVSLGSTLGACLVFWICKTFARDWVETKIKEKTEFRVFLSMLKTKSGHKTVTFLARLSPIPFGLQNSFFALTDISYRDYVLSTFMGLLPFQIVWTHLGTTLRNIRKLTSGEMEFTTFQRVSLVFQIGIVFVIILYFWYLSRKMRRAEAMGETLDYDDNDSPLLPNTSSTNSNHNNSNNSSSTSNNNTNNGLSRINSNNNINNHHNNLESTTTTTLTTATTSLTLLGTPRQLEAGMLDGIISSDTR